MKNDYSVLNTKTPKEVKPEQAPARSDQAIKVRKARLAMNMCCTCGGYK